MTEDQAKDHMCCNSSAGKWRDDGQTEAGFYCRGSACMAWRWLPVPAVYQGVALMVVYPPAPPTEGYCGLAGRP